MTVGLVDTTVIIHLFRKQPAAHAWLKAQTEPLSLTSITWLEVMHGAPGKAGQQTCEVIMSQFELISLTDIDQAWAMRQMKLYRLSHGVGIMDCLIASVAFRLQVPLYTHNLKHMRLLLNDTLVVQPY
jgi:predicted nucleic acid-binding protein